MRRRELFAGATVAASGRAVLDVGGPAVDRCWEVRLVYVGPGIPGTALTGTTRLYVGNPSGAQTSDPPGRMARDEATIFPNPGTWGSWELPVAYGDSLFVVVTGGTTGQAWALNVAAMEWSESEVEARRY